MFALSTLYYIALPMEQTGLKKHHPIISTHPLKCLNDDVSIMSFPLPTLHSFLYSEGVA